ncbi:uncharacterized protein LOC131234292 isoform X2 [Magnolia sinica]|uniref:uncharacterized protein LOC131234292 isoform X2 n=1 Tax=Magnolia sinica TaxID=86752 RepID=UPI00265B080D|nr:uncharacterized protein LOC131234292 isoform X2 [Magnolia sinica]
MLILPTSVVRCSSCVSRFFFRRPFSSRVVSVPRYRSSHMDTETSLFEGRKRATIRLCKVSSFTTELLEMHSEDPSMHILFIPGNPGVVSFYKEFVESLYEQLEGNASITAIGHIAQTRKDWEHGRLFSLQDQINHKVGHSIGSHISLEIFKRLPQEVKYTVGLYPFLAMSKESRVQSMLVKITAFQVLCTAVSSILALIGLLPNWASGFLVRKLVGGRSWSATAVEATCTHLLKYHAMQNILYMAKTEFSKLSEEPEWEFIREKQSQIAFLFGIDDHWGPLTMFEEISKQAPDVALSIEQEGHTHGFSCTEAGSVWVACFLVSLIKRQISY